jgi:hypothetical protein
MNWRSCEKPGRVTIVTKTHARIIALLHRRKLAEACEAVRGDMTKGQVLIVSWVKAQSDTKTKVNP